MIRRPPWPSAFWPPVPGTKARRCASSTTRVDKKLAQLLDRDDMITNLMSTFTSTTVHCARCHNHKFDPISQSDYYALQATLAGVDRAERPFDPDPRVHQQRQTAAGPPASQIATWSDERLRGRRSNDRRPGLGRTRFCRWSRPVAVLPPVDVATTRRIAVDSAARWFAAVWRHASRDRHLPLTLDSTLETITALQLEVLADDSLPQQGPGRQDNGNLHLSEFKLFVLPDDGGEPVPVPIATAFADFEQQDWDILKAIDGSARNRLGNLSRSRPQPHTAVFVLAEPLLIGGHVAAAGRARTTARPRPPDRSAAAVGHRCADPATGQPIPRRLPACWPSPRPAPTGRTAAPS